MDHGIVSLHKHWCTANAVKQFIVSGLDEHDGSDLPPWLSELGNMESMMSRMCVWYALLYVVIEGYKELDVNHVAVDKCLANRDYVNCLRRFRNAIFHYQKNPFSEKLLEFLEAKESEYWIRELNKAFEDFFLNSLPIKEQIDQIKNMA